MFDRQIVRFGSDDNRLFLHPRYYPPFEGAIEAGIGALMCSYNLINGEWSCQNNETLNTDLKERLGFKGFVMSCVGFGPVTAAAQL